MKRRNLFTTAVALMMSVGVVSCASDQEKQEQQRQEEQQRMEEQTHDESQQRMEEDSSFFGSDDSQQQQQQQDSEIFSSDEQSQNQDKPWADQQIELSKVEQVQEELKNKGYNVQVDGLIGPETENAIENFQEEQNLTASGELNQETIDALGVDVDLRQAQEESGSEQMAE